MDVLQAEGVAIWNYAPRQVSKVLLIVLGRLALMNAGKSMLKALPLVGVAIGSESTSTSPLASETSVLNGFKNGWPIRPRSEPKRGRKSPSWMPFSRMNRRPAMSKSMPEDLYQAIWPTGAPIRNISCRHCSVKNRIDVGRAVLKPASCLCGKCGENLFLNEGVPLTNLSPKAYQHSLDSKAWLLREAIPGMSALVRWFT